MIRVAIVGANGRVGSVITRRLQPMFDVIPVTRRPDDTLQSLVDRATQDVDVVVNAAGAAHAAGRDHGLVQLANIELPRRIADRAAEHGISMIHISSTKAEPGNSGPYAESKRECDRQLIDECGPAFERAGLRLVIIRPPAVLVPPFDAGRLALLRWLRWVPRRLTPNVRMPAVTASTLADVLCSAIAGDGTGVRVLRFESTALATLREVRDAMSEAGST